MKSYLINPKLDYDKGNLDATSSTPPLGLLYIASSLRESGIEVKLADQPGMRLSDEELISKVSEYCPEYVLFTVMVDQVNRSGGLSEKIKQELPDTKIVWGGPEATFCADRIMNDYESVDYCIRGPAEESIVRLLNNEDDIPGLVFRENELIKISDNPLGIISDINSLPFPARDLVKGIDYGCISGFKLKGKTGSLISSRGCPYSCIYCACNALTEKKVHFRSINNVIEEMQLLNEQGYKNLVFFDDSLTLNKDRVIELCNKIRDEGLEFNWLFEGRVNHSSKEMFKSMARAGCRMAYFGIESADKETLEYYKKGITPAMAVNAVKTARNAGIPFITASFILGSPNEDYENIKKTMKFIKWLGDSYVDFFQITTLMAYPGTILWDELVSQGKINPKEYWKTGVTVPGLYPDKFPPELTSNHEIEIQAYKEYLYSRRYLVNHLKRAFSGKWRAGITIKNLPYTALSQGSLVTKLTGYYEKDDYAGIKNAINKVYHSLKIDKLIERI